jgi:hypothetical protein
MKELIDIGYQRTPVTLIDSETIVGFDQQKLVEMLGL